MENLSTFGREGAQSGSTEADGSWRYQDRARRGVSVFKNLKLEFPLFNGGMDPEDWSYTVEQLLSYHQVATEEWVTVASINLRGVAAHWSKSFKKSKEMVEWGEFMEGLVARFGESQLTDYKEELFKLRQGGSVADYLNEFDHLSTRISGLSEASLISCFVGGLREDIRLNVKCFQPANLSMVISLAKL